LRQNLTATTVSVTTLEQELRHVKAYLSIEETRFIDRLEVIYDIDEDALLEKIPPLTLQPIVENAVKHGIKDKEQDCLITITIQKRDAMTMVKVEDNGQGMSKERAEQIGKETLQSETGSGLALYNVNRRLSMMFGEEASLKITSTPGVGTDIHFSIPQTEEVDDGQNNQNINS
jgi:two-component system sensor histidine kinase LytS